MNRGITSFALGLGLVGCLAVAGLVWPIANGYVSPLTGPGETLITDNQPKFDRTKLFGELGDKGFALGNEAHVRIFKREHALELWLKGAGERFALFKSYPICTYSGGLGPKLAEGDRQAPEGFYRVAYKQLNPNSRHHLAFNLGFPNAFDQELGRTGSYLMVHGGCSSIGCYAVGDEQVDEIYAVVEAALGAGQREVDVSIFPFRLTDTALAAEAGSNWLPFWQNLKQGSDLFEATGTPPKVAACKGEYVFGDTALAPGCTPITGWV
jgi:murein L,D-transpeptidase YafK